jgi:hypothetical protein
MKKAFSNLVFLAFAALLLYYCSNSSNPTGPGGQGSNTTTQTETGTYRASGFGMGSAWDTIIVTFNPPLINNHGCNQNALQLDTVRSDTQFFHLSGDSLRIRDSQGVSQYVLVLLRSGTGTGIIGTWTNTASTASEAVSMTATISSTVFKMVTTVTRTVPLSDEFITNWNRYGDSLFYNVTLTRTSDNVVTLYGNVDSETVTLTMNANGDQTYSSSNTAHQTYTDYAEPASCPNPPDYAWYNTFLQANHR